MTMPWGLSRHAHIDHADLLRMCWLILPFSSRVHRGMCRDCREIGNEKTCNRASHVHIIEGPST